MSLRQEPLDTQRTAQTTAQHNAVDLGPHTGTLASRSAVAELRGKDGQRYRLDGSTRIGRRPDNDIVLDDDDVSRYHAVIIDTGGSFVISDLRSTNGKPRVRPANRRRKNSTRRQLQACVVGERNRPQRRIHIWTWDTTAS
jgi:pSer/pThr/pTyr-binding forkhead associated (FHA) protein